MAIRPGTLGVWGRAAFGQMGEEDDDDRTARVDRRRPPRRARKRIRTGRPKK